MDANIEVSIRLWSEDESALPNDGEALQDHVEHVARQLGQGYTAGEIIHSGCRGWWEIKR